jgi:hypothetical protein
MTAHPTVDVVLAAILNRYVDLPRKTMDALAQEIVTAVLKHLHETGALSVPPEDIARHADALADPHNATP